ncbi:MAG TPA: hypothetical protein VEG60_12690 [Candidatus Binatia bacterium]|nr:hypothetical protein [Candidatus Binatia bacterium]
MTVRHIRLVSVLVLLTYFITHFINHALGLISLQAEEVARHAGVEVDSFPRYELTVWNRREPLAIYVIKKVQPVVNEQTP